ncbi:MAG: PKD domain-containing protein, partial [Sphingobacteriales bacterium]
SLQYIWHFGDGATETGEQVNHVYSAPGTGPATFSVQVFAQLNQGCSAASQPQNVTVNALPDASIADTISGFSNCTYSALGYTFDLSIINTSATAATNTGYVINWGDGSSVTLGNNFTSAQHQYTTQGAFELTVTATNAAGCSQSKTYSVFNGNNPSFGVASQGNTNGCGPISYTFDILNTANNTPSTTYTFQFDDGTPPVVFNHPPPAQITHLFNNPVPGSATNGYTLTAFATNACGTTPATVGGIKVSIKPQALFKTSPTLNNCTNSPVTVTDNSIAGFNANNPGNPSLYTRSWSITPATGWALSSGSLTSPSYVVSFTTPGSYDITLQVTPGGSSPVCLPDVITKTIVIGVSPEAQFALTSSPVTGCAPLQVATVNNSIGDSLIYNWSVLPATGWNFVLPSSAASATPGFAFTQAGTYTVKLTANNGCSQASSFDTVIVVKGLPTAVLPATQSFCGPQTVTFVNADSAANSGINGQLINYSLGATSGTISELQWQVSGGATFVNNSSATSFSPAINFPSTGTYTVTLVAENECGNSVAASKCASCEYSFVCVCRRFCCSYCFRNR